MSMEKCYENDQALIEYDAIHYALILTWKHFVQGEKYRETLLAFYDLSEQKNIKKWCFDGREHGTIARNDQQWVANETIKRAFHINPIKTALILSRNVFLQHSIDNVIETINTRTNYEASNDIYRIFKTREEGLEWLYE
ncbi:hypothetical protein [Microscilla marina]|uniref:STAS/SEC14 domain-containing protein n=1 Tax=Microscilla marina ATCC 23134 TaxID=313606 RepID=A1ZJK1_MICM2|nr:hypothetical protein [Microscilla marina]EAY29304.1 conserved hypothetical protein [Microscilla marina ATCC 23134]